MVMALKQYLEVRGEYLTKCCKRRIQREGRSLETYMVSKTGPLFVASRTRGKEAHMTPSGILQLVKRLGRAAGLPDSVTCNVHTFRHTAATHMTNNDPPGALVQDVWGLPSFHMPS